MATKSKGHLKKKGLKWENQPFDEHLYDFKLDTTIKNDQKATNTT